MKALRRSLSPFRRRKAAVDLIEDVRRLEESIAGTATTKTFEMASSKGTPDTSQESSGDRSIDFGYPAANVVDSRASQFRRRRRQQQNTDSLEKNVLQSSSSLSFVGGAASNSFRDPGRSSVEDVVGSSSTVSLSGRVRGRHRTPIRDDARRVVVGINKPRDERRRSKSPLFRRKKADQLLQDVRDFERSIEHQQPLPHTPATTTTMVSTAASPRFVPGESCRFHSPSPTRLKQKSSPAAFRSEGGDGSSNICGEDGVEHELTPPRVDDDSAHQKRLLSPAEPPIAISTMISSEQHALVMEQQRSPCRSKSPFRRRKAAETMIADIRMLEIDYASRSSANAAAAAEGTGSMVEVVLTSSTMGNKQRKQAVSSSLPSPSAVDNMPEQSHHSNTTVNNHDTTTIGRLHTVATVPFFNEPAVVGRGRKAFSGRTSLIVQNNATSSTNPFVSNESRKGNNDQSPHKTYSTVSTDCQRTSTSDGPHRHSSGRGTISMVQQSLPRAPGSAIEQSLLKKAASATISENSKGPTLHQTSEIKPTPTVASAVATVNPPTKTAAAANHLTTQSVVPPISISLERRAHISDLSCPIPESFRKERSMGTDSVAKIQNALAKVQDELHCVNASGRKVSRLIVMKKLLEVAESMDSKEDRLKVQRQISRLSADVGLSLSDSSSCMSEERLLRNGEGDETSLSNDDSDTRDTFSDDSSFSQWLLGEDLVKGQWQQLLDVFGLSTIWPNNADAEKDWENLAGDECTEDDENDNNVIPSPPQTKKHFIADFDGSLPFIESSAQTLKDDTARQNVSSTAKLNRQLEIADEEQMLRELEQLENKIKQEKKNKDKSKNLKVGDRLRRLGSEIRKENELLESKRREIEKQAKKDAAVETQLKRLRTKIQTEKNARQLSTKDSIPMKPVESMRIEVATLAPGGESTFSPTSTKSTNEAIALKKRPSWRSRSMSRGRLHRESVLLSRENAKSPTLGHSFQPSDVEDGALSLGSIESHHFSKTSTQPSNGVGDSRRTHSLLRRQLDDDDNTRLAELGLLTYTQKTVQLKMLNAKEALLIEQQQQKSRQRGTSNMGVPPLPRDKDDDEDRSDQVHLATTPRGRGRNRESRQRMFHV